MKKNFFFTFFTFFTLLAFSTFFTPQRVLAQQNSALDVYSSAEANYNAGRFDEVEKELISVVKSLKGMYKSGAYRLLAMCELEEGDIESAKSYVSLLLKSDPYYTPTLNDPQRLVDLINEAKDEQQNSGITTASRQAESVEEAPVPVTVITEDMIKQAGASTLQELLCLFVPGMSNIEGMESNIAMHGIYGLNQDKILFLQDGHRLNGGSTNAEAPDYRNSLDKIKQIEVLRGPASSLYGNVALTAVVNIITRTGGRMNGGRVSGTFGTQKTFGGSFVVGGGNNVVDILGWGSVNTTKGFKHEIANDLGGTTTLYSNGYFQRPSYDVGIKAKWNEFSMTISSQRSKRSPYMNVLQFSATQKIVTDPTTKTQYVSPVGVYNTVQNFNIDRYGCVGSNGPGTTRTNHHINLDWSHDIGKVNLQASGYVSMENTSLYNVMGDSIPTSVGYALLLLMQQSTGSSVSAGLTPQEQEALMKLYVKTKGVFQMMDWENISFGGMLQATLTKYDFGKFGHGSALVGVQYDHFALTNAMLYIGGNYSTDQMISSGEVFSDGKEDVISGFAQFKHYFSNNLIINAGLRYDHKRRFNANRLNHLSPRASLIYKINPTFSLRGSYNYSFVDAPYIYRACNVAMFSGGVDMKPEKMSSIQVSLLMNKLKNQTKGNFQAELNLFYNRLSDLITTSIAIKENIVGGYLFLNSGNVKQCGTDLSMRYTSPRFFVNFNATWQRVLSSTRYSVVKGNRVGIPQFMGNIVGAWSPYKSKNTGTRFFSNGKLWLNVNANIMSKTYYQQVDMLSSYFAGNEFYVNNIEVAPRIIVGVGVTYEWKGLELNLSARNLTNDQYKVCSMLNDGIPHAGRQILGKVTIKF